MDQLIVEQFCTKINTKKNEKLPYVLWRTRRAKDIAFVRIFLIKPKMNVRFLLDCVHQYMYNQINKKCSHFPIIHF